MNTMTPIQKAWQTRRARKAAAVLALDAYTMTEIEQTDGSKLVTFTLVVPKGFHAIGPELDQNDDE